MRRALLMPVAVSVAAAAFGSSSAVAQSLWLGGRGGLAVSQALFEDEINDGRTDPRLGFQIGGIAEKPLSRAMALRLELLYTEKGWTEFNTAGERRFGYIEVPIALSLRIPSFPVPNLSLGTYASFEVNCAVTGVPAVGSVSCSDPAVTTSRKRVDFGVLAGLGLELGVLGGRLGTDYTAMLGLHDLNSEPVPPGYLRLAAVLWTIRYTRATGG